jgi:PDZ domain/Aspartyl protease
MKLIRILAVLCLFIGSARADERLLVDARADGRPGKFAFDSGASDMIIFPDGVERLGLRMLPPRTNAASSNGMIMIYTALTPFELGQNSFWTTFTVMGRPAYLDASIDGLIGWSRVKRNIFRIDAAGLEVEPLTNAPDETAGWLQFRVAAAKMLTLQMPGAGSNIATVMVDTADDRGVSLSPRRWREWRAANPKQPATVSAVIMPGYGVSVKEQCWVKELAFGPLTLTNVPVTEFNESQAELGSTNNEAILGIAALKQLDLIVDGNHGIAYVQPRPGPQPPYQHNRLGAVFAPGDSDDFAAHVATGSPAAEAGILNGDVLLKIGDLDVTKWQTDPAVLPLSRFWNRPAGEKLELTLKRGGETLKKTVVLKDILGPEKSSASEKQK